MQQILWMLSIALKKVWLFLCPFPLNWHSLRIEYVDTHISLQDWSLEPISPPNSCNAQRRQQKVNCTKDAALFHQHFCRNFTAHFRLQLLHRAPYFGTTLPTDVAIKNIKMIYFGAKMLAELTPDGNMLNRWKVASPHFFSVGSAFPADRQIWWN